MRPVPLLLLSFALGTLACAKPFPCNRYCWSHQQAVADVTSSLGSGAFKASQPGTP